jgi:hypothetical protein
MYFTYQFEHVYIYADSWPYGYVGTHIYEFVFTNGRIERTEVEAEYLTEYILLAFSS